MITQTVSVNKGNLFPSKIIRHERKKSETLFYSDNNVVLNVIVLREGLLRFRYTTKGYFSDDFSYAVDLQQSYGYNSLNFKEEPDYFEIKTSKVICKIHKVTFKISLFDLNGLCILEDELGFHWEELQEYGGNIVKMTKVTQSGENFYGLGDKATHFNLKGKRLTNWVTDQYAFQKDQDPLYKAIPFYIGMHSGISYGIFFDNTFKTSFDFSSERKNVTSFWADGGEMNYYFFYGPSMNEVVVSYTQLTGVPKMPPMWALGYQQSKWSYSTENVFKDIGDKFRELQIPCDVLHLDIDYMDGFRCFTWNKTNFPNPKAMVSNLLKKGFKTVVIVDPGIKADDVDYEVYKEGIKNHFFCERADGPNMIGKVWPGICCFPDFTNPDVRNWWSGLFKELIGDIGVSGIWSDMNEPAVMEVPEKTFPNDVRHNFDGHLCSHRKAHNIYGMQMVRATYHGIKKFGSPNRPFNITRAAYAGTQRYSSTWTGDNLASWEHLWIANIQIQRLSLCGFSFCGSDIGGFAEQPTSELFARWIQLGSFHPFFRVHSSGQHGNQEPWSFGKDIMAIAKKFIELRYQLLPYLYTAFWQYVKEGMPIIKALVLYDQDDIQTHYRNDEWVYGNHMLICPILEPNSLGRRMYVPKGRWYNFWNNTLLEGKEEIWIETSIDTMPIFVLEGSIIPRYPIQQYVGEKVFEYISLDAYYKEGKEVSYLYEDLHDGYEYLKGDFLSSTFTLIGKEDELVITQHQRGVYKVPYKYFIIKLIGIPFEIAKIEIDHEVVPIKEVVNGHYNELKVSQSFSEIRIYGKS